MSHKLRQLLHSLTGHFLLVATLSFCFLIAGVVYDGNRTLNAAVIANVKASIKQTSQLLNLTVSTYVSAGELETVQVFFSEMLDARSDNGLVYVMVIGADGRPLFNTLGADASVPIPSVLDHLTVDGLRSGILHVRNPLLLPGRKVGYLQYGLSVKNLIEATRSEQINSVLRICLIMFATFVVILLLGLRISRRLHEITLASKEMVSGNYKQSIQVSGHDELAILARNFNLMAAEVSRKIQEVTDLNQTLEDKVAQRTFEYELSNRLLEENLQHLQTAHDQLVQSEKLAALGAIVAAVAHELNTPIGNCLAVASTMQNDTVQLERDMAAGELRRSQLNQYMETVGEGLVLLLRGLDRTVKLVTSFKQVAVDQTAERRRRFDLQEVIEGVVALMQTTLKSTPYRVELQIAHGIEMDSYPGPVEQIIANLINNSVLHGFNGRDHGVIHIAAEAEGGMVRVVYSDDGLGMSEDVQRHIFDPFFTTRLGSGGSGLGMSICYNLVTGPLGGTLSVISDLGKGCEFTLMLPDKAPIREENKPK